MVNKVEYYIDIRTVYFTRF